MSSSGTHHVIWSSQGLVAYLSPRPWTPGSVVLERNPPGAPGGSVFELEEQHYVSMLLGAKAVALRLCEKMALHRCALVSRHHSDRPPQVQLLPLHGLDAEWRPCLAAEEEYHMQDPGYCTSKSGPRWCESQLTELQAQIRAALPDPEAPANLSFLGEDPSHSGLFSRIVRGEEHHWRLWEDDTHVAFLTPFPNMPGLTVVVPRKPLPSDIFRLEEPDYKALLRATREVALLLQRGLGASAVGLIFEGFEIDYAHAKLIPLSSSGAGSGRLEATPFYSLYPGFVSSEEGPEASAYSLSQLCSLLAEHQCPHA